MFFGSIITIFQLQLEIVKMNGFFNESSRVHGRNSAQNRDFLENPRGDLTKITKMSRKNDLLDVIAEKP